MSIGEYDGKDRIDWVCDICGKPFIGSKGFYLMTCIECYIKEKERIKNEYR